MVGGGLRRSAGGWQGVYELRRKKEYWRGDDRILGDGSFVTAALKAAEEELSRKERLRRSGWDLEKIIQKVCQSMGIKEDELLQKGRDNQRSKARMLVCCLANKEVGINGSTIGARLKISKQAVAKLIQNGEHLKKEIALMLTS